MLRILIALILCLLLAESVVADDRAKLLGSWKVISWVQEFQDGSESRPEYGRNPIGYIIFTPGGRMMAMLEGEGRKSPTSDQDRLVLFRTMAAYTGKYSVEGDKWTTKVDAAWHPDRRGTDQVRFFKLEGDKLYVTSPFRANPNLANRVARSLLVLEREK